MYDQMHILHIAQCKSSNSQLIVLCLNKEIHCKLILATDMIINTPLIPMIDTDWELHLWIRDMSPAFSRYRC